MRTWKQLLTPAALALALVAPVSRSDAQIVGNYGSYGWGGWGSDTVGGNVARGLGAYAAGLGQYKINSAQAAAIAADTRMRYNEYLWQSEMLRRQRNLQRAARDQAQSLDLADYQHKQLYEPRDADIAGGDTLNAMLHQLSNPSLPESIFNNASGGLKLTGEQVASIPFQFSRAGVIISLDRMTGDEDWPAALAAEPFGPLREQYSAWLDEVDQWPDDQPFPDAKIGEGVALIQRMRDEAKKSLDGPRFVQAERFLKGHLGMLQAAREPDVKEFITQAKALENVPLVNLIDFMHLFSLGFGPSRTAEEKALYAQTLYPAFRDMRDRIEKEMGQPIPTEADIVARARDERLHATDLFRDRDWNELSRQGAPAQPPADPNDLPTDPAPAPDRDQPKSENPPR